MSDPAQPIERRIELPQLALAALAWGQPTLPPLLALHGWLDNAASFSLLAPLLATRFHIIAPDLPGHGHSAHLPAGATYHFDDYVRTLLAALDTLPASPLTLLGHSLGAGVAALVAAAAPQRIARLLLIEGLGPLGDDGTHTLQRWRDALAPDAPARRPLRLFTSIEQAVSARSRASGLDETLARPIVERGLCRADHGWRWRSDARLTRASTMRLAESQIRALLRGIDMPAALLLAQPETPYLPAAMMRERAACVPDLRLTLMHGGHHLHLEHPQAVADWILDAAAS